MRKPLLIGFIMLMPLTFSVILAQQRGIQVTGKDGGMSEPTYHAVWALLIGINKYPNLPGKYQLSYAVNDVIELKQVLMEYYQFPESNIITLTDEQATYQNIKEKMAQLSDIMKIDRNDCVLIFFSGHGQNVPLPRGGEMGFLIPYDAKVDMDNVKSPSTYYSTCLDMDQLRLLGSMIPAKHVLFMVDACFSGLAVKKGGFKPAIPGYLRKVASVPVQQIITAGMKKDESSENPKWGHGAFTYKLLEALRTGVADWDEDGVITALELATYLAKVVPDISPDQVPQYDRFEGEGEFLFIRSNLPKESPQPISVVPSDVAKPESTASPSAPEPDTIPPREEPEDLTSLSSRIVAKDGAEMVLIPAGEFQMGSNDGDDDEKPAHTVYLDAFYMDIYEVTNAQYRSFVQATGHKEPEGFGLVNGNWQAGFKPWSDKDFNGDDKPVVCVSWNDAKAYCEWAGERLPTEAEWEKAARGGFVGKKYPWGDTISQEDANYSGTGGRDVWEVSASVGSFALNAYGLYDMIGNVWEWCADWYDEGYYANSGERNPAGPGSGKFRVLRGSSWDDDADFIRVTYRHGYGPAGSSSNVGFRCAGSAKASVPP